ncbi:hypothetical protein VTL71DRAFT_8643 [Oculimacula yallundae]|uniref:Uncharacterized protein n=1 Tax=Oculimacula yallundae TaxID=86028 RepID=A0ABR4CY77_9HELO
MAVNKNLDLQAERAKAVAVVTLIDDILVKEKTINEEEMALSSAHENYESLGIELEELGSQVTKLESIFEAEAMRFSIKKDNWHQKNVRIETIAFPTENHTNNDDLDKRIKLMEENTGILIQCKELNNLRAKLEEMQGKYKSTGELTMAVGATISRLQSKIKDFTIAVDQLRYTLPSSELSIAKDTIKSQADEIKALNGVVLVKQQCNGLLSAQLENAKTMNQTLFRFTPVKLNDVAEDDSKTVVENMRTAYGEGRNYQFREMIGPYEAGCAVRARKLAWMKPNKNDLVVSKGNEASHYGKALADATLFRPTCPDAYRIVDTNVFKEFYGVSNSFVWKSQSVRQLLIVLDWRGAMINFCSSPSSKIEEAEAFERLFHLVILSIKTRGLTSEEMEKILADDCNVTAIADMKRIHDAGLVKHNAVLKARRNS